MPQSGQLQLIDRSREDSGNSGVPQPEKTCSISGGISPASSRARNSAWPARRDSTSRHWAAVSGRTVIDTLYGWGREPWTRAVTLPVASLNSMTWPRRA